MKINTQVKKIFKIADGSRYMPHLSLIYGNYSSRTKKEIIRSTGKNFDMRFTTKSISIFDTTGIPEEWKIVKEIEFTGAA